VRRVEVHGKYATREIICAQVGRTCASQKVCRSARLVWFMATRARGGRGMHGCVAGVLLLLSLLECSCDVTEVNPTSDWKAAITAAPGACVCRRLADMVTRVQSRAQM